MNIKRFFGKNSKAALAQVREALGDDAVILSNRVVDGGNEIMAFREDDIDTIPRYNGLENDQEGKVIEDSRTSSLEALFRKRSQVEPAVVAAAYADDDSGNDYQVNISKQSTSSQLSADASAQIASMMREIRNMRAVIESQLTEITWATIQHRDPVKSKLLGRMLSAGFSASLSKHLAENVPANQNEVAALKWAQTILANNMNTITREDELLDQGGVFAVIGPTGVGKTTTTAKLAARYVMKHGAEKLGLITTDAYRIGGHEQLRIYGKILGVMVHTVKDEADLQIALKELKNKHTILIDTVGVSQRDRMVSEQIAMLSGAKANIKKLLCLNATNTGETLTDVVRAYKGRGLDGCIMTKTDEAQTIGNVLDVIIREKIKLYYVANGQRVPEDIKVANKQELISHAFKLSVPKTSPYRLNDEDLPLVMGQTTNAETKPGKLELAHV